jgi:hypothetical protein
MQWSELKIKPDVCSQGNFGTLVGSLFQPVTHSS